MRKGFNGLSGIIQEHYEKNPEEATVYVFINKRGNKIKILHRTPKGFTRKCKEDRQINNKSIRIYTSKIIR